MKKLNEYSQGDLYKLVDYFGLRSWQNEELFSFEDIRFAIYEAIFKKICDCFDCDSSDVLTDNFTDMGEYTLGQVIDFVICEAFSLDYNRLHLCSMFNIKFKQPQKIKLLLDSWGKDFLSGFRINDDKCLILTRSIK